MFRSLLRLQSHFGNTLSLSKVCTRSQKLWFSRKYSSAVAERRRFYQDVSISQGEGGLYEINLDRRKLKTPGGKLFTVPNEALAIAVATEWDVQRDTLKFYTMHLTDTVCYRVDEPHGLVELQKNEWDPVLQWIENRYNVTIGSSSSILGPDIPAATKDTFQQHLNSYNFWSLTGLEYVITQLKSVVLSMAMIDRHLSVEEAVLLSRLEEEYQIQRWGSVEWAHDYDMYELRARTAAGALFVHLSSESSTVKQRATDGSLQSEDWTLNMEICDIINETEDGPKDAIRAVKKRLNGNRNYREVMLTLTVLETCVKNCGHRFHALVTSRDFVDGVLVKIISPKNNPPTIVQDKVLALIQAWADAFRSSPDLTGVVQIYEEMKRKGIEFPMSDLETLSPIHTPQRAASAPEGGDSSVLKFSATPQPTPHTVPPAYTDPQVPNLPASGAINPTPEQICRLRSELDVVRGNTKVMSEMLTEMVPGQEDASDYELLQELNRTCRAMQHRIMELISCVSNEAVTEELLHVNDDLNNIFLRYERYERFRSGRSSAQTVNNGVLSEATEDNLIDLGPGSPAVVSNMSNVAPAQSITAPVGGPSSPATLASRLAGLDMGSDSVSSTLSSLSSCKPPPPAQDDFDVFAQTRTGVVSEPHKTTAAGDNRASGNPPTLDVVQPTAGGGVARQSSVMDDIEEWLCTDVKGDEGEEGVTSEEFDKFLEERAKAAEMTPSLPSPPSGDPGATQGTPSRKKPDRPEDALFAM
ncbi:TOM1 2 isoform X1 [Solea senegalensis]|uniref:TOM1 2 isoform X1 n=1 Tax=Solea senegalensis TaxID=28829 RepID=A0AAV6RNX5_SOLSE|nr:TOM1 2 isoform X1 [Solea senegalensis]